MKHFLMSTVIGLLSSIAIISQAEARVLPGASLPSSSSSTTVSHRPSRRVIRSAVKDHPRTAEGRYSTLSTLSLKGSYDNQDLRVHIRYPDEWKRQDIQETNGTLALVVMFLGPTRPGGPAVVTNINLVTEQLTDLMTLEQYSTLAVASEQLVFDTFTISSEKTIQLGQSQAHQIEFIASQGQTKLSYRQIWYIKNHTAYVWTYAEMPEFFEKNLYIFERMMDSLRME